MRLCMVAAMLLAFCVMFGSLVNNNHAAAETAAGLPAEGSMESFMGEPKMEIQEVFSGERFPNVVVTTDGTVLATWGRSNFRARRSEDGGKSWGEAIRIAGGIHGGGVTVDETTGKIFVFIEDGHPPAPLIVYRSADDGETWQEEDISIQSDTKGNVLSMHMNERGITLRHGKQKGRLLRPARDYAGGNQRSEYPNHYTTAIYSDDYGKTWHTSDPFPEFGTGEAAAVELSDGTIYYNSRRHWAPDGKNPRQRWEAWSRDGGETWEEAAINEVLPDGAQHRDYGLMGGLVRLPVAGEDILVFSNIVSESGRRNGHVWASFDGGKTWPLKRQVDSGSFAYSSLTAGRPDTPSEGWIYLMYEGGGGAKIARFNLAWLLEGEPTGDGKVPDWAKGQNR